MGLAQFILFLAMVGIAFNVFVLYKYFRPEVTEFFGGKEKVSEEKRNNKLPVAQIRENVLVGSTRDNDLAYVPRQMREQLEDREVEVYIPDRPLQGPAQFSDNNSVHHADKGENGEHTGPPVDNSFSTDELIQTMEQLGASVLSGTDRMEPKSDVLSQISRSGILKVGVRSGGRTIDRDVMVLENTVVL